jgi:hypothetical protein
MTFTEMLNRGGHFEQAICKAFVFADAFNLKKLEKAFPDISKKFEEMKKGNDD